MPTLCPGVSFVSFLQWLPPYLPFFFFSPSHPFFFFFPPQFLFGLRSSVGTGLISGFLDIFTGLLRPIWSEVAKLNPVPAPQSKISPLVFFPPVLFLFGPVPKNWVILSFFSVLILRFSASFLLRIPLRIGFPLKSLPFSLPLCPPVQFLSILIPPTTLFPNLATPSRRSIVFNLPPPLPPHPTPSNLTHRDILFFGEQIFHVEQWAPKKQPICFYRPVLYLFSPVCPLFLGSK